MSLTFFLKLAGQALVIYGLLMALLYFTQEKMQFYPDTRRVTPAQTGYTGFLPVTVTTADGLELEGWYAAARPGMRTVLMYHGNAGSHGWRAEKFMPLVAKGYGVLIAGYRGYGGNPGAPNETGLYLDAKAFADFLLAQKITPQQTVYYGESLGTGIAIDTATAHPDIAGLVLEAPYTSFNALAGHHYSYMPLIDRLVRNRFASIDKIEKLTMPKLFLMGGHDAVVPPVFTRQLFERAADPKILKVYEDAGHSNITPAAMADVEAFLSQLE